MMLLTVNVRFGLVIVLHGASVFQDVCRLMELAQSKTLPALGQRKKKAWRNHEKGLLLKRRIHFCTWMFIAALFIITKT